MFKVGDTVKNIKDITVGRVSVGTSGVVERNDGVHVMVNHGNETLPYYSHELELLKEIKMDAKVNYHLLGDSVIINHKAKTTVIRRGDIRFDQVVQAIREGRLAEIPELIDTEAAFTKKGLVLKDGLLYMDGDALPESLSQRVMDLVEAQMPIDIMVRFWKNLKANPSFNSRKMLYAFLEHNGHPLTEDGCFIAYRGVTEDFKDIHTKTFNNSVGQVVEIDRSLVDDNPNNTCSSGLHVACHDYAKGFGPKLIEVKVNPKDVVTVPVDYNGTKMRVCKFEVMAECEQLLTGPVYAPKASLWDEDDSLDEADIADFESDDDYYDSDNY